MNTICKGAAALGCAVFIAASTAACGTEELSAGSKVERAVDELAGREAVTMTLGFDGTEQQIWSAARGQDGFDREAAKVLAELEIAMSFSSEKPLKDAVSKESDTAVRVLRGREGELLEYRVLNGKEVFLQVGFEEITSLVAEAGGEEARKDLKEFDSFVDSVDGLPSSYQSLKDVFAGKWVSIDLKAYQEFAEDLGEGAATPPVPDLQSLDAGTERKVREALREAVGGNAEFADAGERDGAEVVEVTVPARKTAKAVVEALKPLEKQLQLPREDMLLAVEDIPRKGIVFDVAIEDGKLSRVTLDLAQLDEDFKGELPLSLSFADASEPVAAPAHATRLDPQDIMGAVMQLTLAEANA